MPITLNDDVLLVAISDPLNFDTLDNLRFLLKREIETVCATPEQIDQSLIKYYGSAEEAGDVLLGGLGRDADLQAMDLTAAATDDTNTGDSAIIKLVSLLLLEAYKMRASDIHLEPLEKRFRIRFRIDGVLQEMQNPPKNLQSAIVSRLKIMSNTMSIAEKRLPQDGRIQVKMGKNIHRPARFHDSHQSRRKRGDAYPGQIEPDARTAGTGFPDRRPGHVRAHDHAAGRHPAGHGARPARARRRRCTRA